MKKTNISLLETIEYSKWLNIKPKSTRNKNTSFPIISLPVSKMLIKNQLSKKKVELEIENYQSWKFKNLNMVFGTDSQPFIIFISKCSNIITLGIKMNMVLLNYQCVARISHDELVFAGGVNYTFNRVTSKSYQYNIRTGRLNKMDRLIQKRFCGQMVFVNHRLIIIGGREYGNVSVAVLKSCEEYDFNNNKWKRIGDMIYPRCNFSIMVYDHNVYVFGGLTKDSSAMLSIEIYNTDRQRWELLGVSLTQGLMGHLSFVKSNKVLIFGWSKTIEQGIINEFDLSKGADIANVEVMNFETKGLLAKPIVLNNCVLIVGGSDSTHVYIDLETFKILENFKQSKKVTKIVDYFENFLSKANTLTNCSSVLPFTFKEF